MESTWHIFPVYGESIACWRKSNLWQVLQAIMLDCDGFWRLFQTYLESFDYGPATMFFGQGMEHLEERNMVLCEDVCDTADQGVT